jgi:hypothetical protein
MKQSIVDYMSDGAAKGSSAYTVTVLISANLGKEALVYSKVSKISGVEGVADGVEGTIYDFKARLKGSDEQIKKSLEEIRGTDGVLDVKEFYVS